MVEITEIDRDEALRYLCCHDENNIGETAGKYLDECESRLLGVISPKFLYRYFPLSFKDGVPVISGCTLTLNGSDIAAHLEGCSGVIVMCATVGGGVVTATVNGKKEVLSLSIKPEAVDPDDVEMLQDMIMAAVNEAMRTADTEAANNMSRLTGGLNLGGLF